MANLAVFLSFMTKENGMKSEIRVCCRCKTPVEISEVDGYCYYCPEHDEDLYEFETEEIVKYHQETE